MYTRRIDQNRRDAGPSFKGRVHTFGAAHQRDEMQVERLTLCNTWRNLFYGSGTSKYLTFHAIKWQINASQLNHQLLLVKPWIGHGFIRQFAHDLHRYTKKALSCGVWSTSWCLFAQDKIPLRVENSFDQLCFPKAPEKHFNGVNNKNNPNEKNGTAKGINNKGFRREECWWDTAWRPI